MTLLRRAAGNLPLSCAKSDANSLYSHKI